MRHLQQAARAWSIATAAPDFVCDVFDRAAPEVNRTRVIEEALVNAPRIHWPAWLLRPYRHRPPTKSKPRQRIRTRTRTATSEPPQRTRGEGVCAARTAIGALEDSLIRSREQDLGRRNRKSRRPSGGDRSYAIWRSGRIVAKALLCLRVPRAAHDCIVRFRPSWRRCHPDGRVVTAVLAPRATMPSTPMSASFDGTRVSWRRNAVLDLWKRS
jgi:hypothetical protein